MPVIKKTKANYTRPAQSLEILEISQPLICPISGTYWHTWFSWTKGPDKLVSVTPVPKNSSWGQGHLDKSKLGYGHRPGEVDCDHNQQKNRARKASKKSRKMQGTCHIISTETGWLVRYLHMSFSLHDDMYWDHVPWMQARGAHYMQLSTRAEYTRGRAQIQVTSLSGVSLSSNVCAL